MKPFFLLLLVTSLSTAQHTLSLPENETEPKATLADASFMTGHWIGEAFGGISEEIWTKAEGDSMMFSFRLVIDGKVDFYEIGHIIEEGETIHLQLKHFSGELDGWEAKDEFQDFPLVKKEDNALYFDGLTYKRISDNEMIAYVLAEEENGSTQEFKFIFKKQ
ncbi:hypothetical protein Celal_1850 [Cellulophaga algicola DSM 14237]|uniref:DUF6265 domain-containing protein n=1 Tax=Cellulophaga algicola (strain DSM 14237 / IC166 / ACAM 630) TaxID=688270 RepID=E6XE69_CELAD|nr:DUF6265 family protein [Cellulophaga algicola]ADV49150.1 hypothetical protein Celal_1850 [Cellulophaga algicola DSM 14237]